MENYDFKGNRIDYNKVRLKAKKEVFDDIENKWLYKRDKKVYGQRFIITIGETRWKELKKKHLQPK